ncbi:MAG: pyridoxal-phosphate dependent enzyme [Comamonadaceae bacterium]|nr:pyridoxal-phosphate dependent enzyme [Comamonadaceae bacterium]
MVEGTAGNTGIGFAHLCNARGYRCVIVMPDNQSPEKAALLRTLGAEVQRREDRALQRPEPLPEARAAAWRPSIDGAACGNQFDNTANRDAHYATTGPEIWHETGGRIDAFVVRHGHRRHARRRVALPQGAEARRAHRARRSRCGSALYHWVKTGTLKSEGSSAVTEGIGIGRVTANLEGAPIDDAVRVERRRDRAHRLPSCCTARACSSAAPAAPTSRPRCSVAPRPRPGQHHRHHPLRRRPQVPVALLEPRVPAAEGSRGARRRCTPGHRRLSPVRRLAAAVGGRSPMHAFSAEYCRCPRIIRFLGRLRTERPHARPDAGSSAADFFDHQARGGKPRPARDRLATR